MKKFLIIIPILSIFIPAFIGFSADNKVVVSTIQVKRIVEALKNIEEGIYENDAFNTRHDVSGKLNTQGNIPSGLSKADYAFVSTLWTDVQALLTKYATQIYKFETFDTGGTADPLDRLGKRWAIQGEPVRDFLKQ